MNKNISSYIKGEKFEKYVEKYLFPEKYYSIIHRTNTYEQNKERFAEDTKKPDYKFKCKKTGQEFYVEAKFRTKFNNAKKIEVISLSQFRRFETLQDEEKCPIYMIIGYGGDPSNPSSISIIPIEKMEHLSLYKSYLRNYNINKNRINCDTLKIEKLTNNIIKETKKTENNNEKLNSRNRTSNIKSKGKNKTIPIVIIATLVIATIISTIYYSNSPNSLKNEIETKLKGRVSQYYNNLKLRNIEDLNEFINPKVDKWYGKSNITLKEIKIDANKYFEKYPNTKTDVLWDTFKVSKINNDYLVSYQMVYKIKGVNENKTKTFHLKITSIWDENLKMKSITEDKI